MKIFSLSDLHLAEGTPGKSMAVFGEHWNDHARKIEKNWNQQISDNDIVLVAGDISWAMKLERALPDLQFIGRLPGRKVLIRGNHDYWWASPKKIRELLPEGLYIIQNDALTLDGVSLAGSRLWTDHELPDLLPSAGKKTDSTGNGISPEDRERDEKIFQRELNRLSLSLEKLDANAALRIAMVHFPPIASDLNETRTTRLLEGAGVQHCVFGHLHNVPPMPGKSFFGCRQGIAYHLTSCDYLDFMPALIAEI